MKEKVAEEKFVSFVGACGWTPGLVISRFLLEDCTWRGAKSRNLEHGTMR